MNVPFTRVECKADLEAKQIKVRSNFIDSSADAEHSELGSTDAQQPDSELGGALFDTIEAMAIIDKAERIFYVSKKLTPWLVDLRNMVLCLMSDALTTGNRHDALNHMRLTALGLVHFRCQDCKRCYASRPRLHCHKAMCGVDDVRYGYL